MVRDGARDQARRRATAVPLIAVRPGSWDLSPSEACALQARLSGQAETRDRLDAPVLVAGIDVGFEDQGRITRAAVAVLRSSDLRLVESALARRPTQFPYVPGLLSFREIPAALGALAMLACTPDLLLCDGQGLAHPRRFGLACHLGWLVDTPTIGVAKSRLLGEFTPPPAERGAWTPLWGPRRAGRRRRAHAARRQAAVRFARTPGRRGERGAPDARLYRPLPLARAEPYCPPVRIKQLIAFRRPAPGARALSDGPRCRPTLAPSDRPPPDACGF